MFSGERQLLGRVGFFALLLALLARRRRRLLCRELGLLGGLSLLRWQVALWPSRRRRQSRPPRHKARRKADVRATLITLMAFHTKNNISIARFAHATVN